MAGILGATAKKGGSVSVGMSDKKGGSVMSERFKSPKHMGKKERCGESSEAGRGNLCSV